MEKRGHLTDSVRTKSRSQIRVRSFILANLLYQVYITSTVMPRFYNSACQVTVNSSHCQIIIQHKGNGSLFKFIFTLCNSTALQYPQRRTVAGTRLQQLIFCSHHENGLIQWCLFLSLWAYRIYGIKAIVMSHQNNEILDMLHSHYFYFLTDYGLSTIIQLIGLLINRTPS